MKIAIFNADSDYFLQRLTSSQSCNTLWILGIKRAFESEEPGSQPLESTMSFVKLTEGLRVT